MKKMIMVTILLITLLSICIASPVYAQELTPAEAAYALTIADHAFRVGDAFTRLGELIQNPQMGDDVWTLSVAAQLVTIQLLYEEAMEIEPPSSMAHIHYKYVQGMKHYDKSTRLVAKGFDELDVNLIEEATVEINRGEASINEATQLMEEFTEARSAEPAPTPTPAPTPAPTPPTAPEPEEDEGCFIATAAYGTDTAQEIYILRDFRDRVLLPNSLGAEFVSSYYECSPPVADFVSKHELLRTIIREILIDPIVVALNWTQDLWR